MHKAGKNFDASQVKLILFDVFNTLVSMDKCERTELRAYAEHIKAHSTPDVWKPWEPSPLWWSTHCKAFPDVYVSLRRLRMIHYVATMTNAPVWFQMRLNAVNNMQFDALTPLECFKMFKPHKEIYPLVANLYGLKPEGCLMVTANETFGDIEGAHACGMQAVLIDRANNHNGDCVRDISELYEIFHLAKVNQL